jgi:hypothetical protein
VLKAGRREWIELDVIPIMIVNLFFLPRHSLQETPV